MITMWQLSTYCLSCPNLSLIDCLTSCLQPRESSHSHGYSLDLVIRDNCKLLIISISYTPASIMYLLSVHCCHPLISPGNDSSLIHYLKLSLSLGHLHSLLIQFNSWVILIIFLTFTLSSLAPSLPALYCFVKLQLGQVLLSLNLQPHSSAFLEENLQHSDYFTIQHINLKRVLTIDRKLQSSFSFPYNYFTFFFHPQA